MSAGRFANAVAVTATAALLAGLAPAADAADADPVEQALQAAVDSEIRTAEERDRDANRKPIETLRFFGLRPDMRVLELLPGGGWYTKILAPVLREQGKLYVFTGPRDGVTALIAQHPTLDRVEVLDVAVAMTPTDQPGVFEAESFTFPVHDLDLVVTFRNVHNFTARARANLFRAVYASLAPGGLFGVVDHTRRHMAPDTAEVWRRIDPVKVIWEVERSGFEFVAFSDLHYRPDDELRYEVQRKTVAGNSDRFTLLFRKPE